MAEMLRGLSDFSSFSLSSDLTFVCWKINNPLMNICHSAITLPLCRDALDASGLAKADWWNCPWTFVSNNLVFPFLSFPFLFFRLYQNCKMEVLLAKQMKVNTLCEWTHAVHSMTPQCSLDKVFASSESSKIIIRFVMLERLFCLLE